MSGRTHFINAIARPSTRAYTTYKSPYGPKYKVQPNVAGWTIGNVTNLGRQDNYAAGTGLTTSGFSGLTLASFGGVAGFFAIFFFSDVPRLRKDVMQKIPIIGEHFVKEVPASDNPF